MNDCEKKIRNYADERGDVDIDEVRSLLNRIG